MTANEKQEGGDHYLNMVVEPWQVVDGWSKIERVAFYRGNALKYLMRMGAKDSPAQEVAKARHYLDKLLEVLAED